MLQAAILQNPDNITVYEKTNAERNVKSIVRFDLEVIGIVSHVEPTVDTISQCITAAIY